MKKGNSDIIIVIVLFLIIAIVVYKVFSKKAVTSAKSLEKQYGGIKESDMPDFLYKIWRHVGYSDEAANAAIRNKTAWSAAFISYVFRNYPDFPKSASHSNYIVATRKNEQSGKGTFRLKRIDEYRPKVGDVVCKNRNGGNHTYDSIYSGAQTHCDIVTRVNPNSLTTIGGNVSDTVKITEVPTQNGYISKDGYFAVIANLNLK